MPKKKSKKPKPSKPKIVRGKKPPTIQTVPDEPTTEEATIALRATAASVRFAALPTFDLQKTGEVRRQHEALSDKLDEVLPLSDKLESIDRTLSRMILCTDCDDLEAITSRVLCWAAELTAVHYQKRHGIELSDDQIERGKLFFPTDTVMQVLHAFNEFKERVRHDDETCIKFLTMRLSGDPNKAIAIN